MSTRWDVDQYTRFHGPRLRPGIDLMARIDHRAARRVVDLGCGIGDLTRMLGERWPDARVTGMDQSPDMVAKARATYPGLDIVQADLTVWRPDRPVDVLFCNAVLMWLRDHDRLFPRLLGLVAPAGVLAVQMSDNFQSPAHRGISETLAALGLSDRVAPLEDPVAPAGHYCRLLAPLTAALDVWQTTYWHRLTGPDPVVEWLKGTALRPVLQGLDDADRARFLEAYRDTVARAYPPEADGSTWFPFRRLFLVARLPDLDGGASS